MGMDSLKHEILHKKFQKLLKNGKTLGIYRRYGGRRTPIVPFVAHKAAERALKTEGPGRVFIWARQGFYMGQAGFLYGPARMPLNFIIATDISTLLRKNAFPSHNTLKQCQILL